MSHQEFTGYEEYPEPEAPRPESSAVTIAVLFLTAVLLCGIYAAHRALSPPRVTFAAPVIEVNVKQPLIAYGPLNQAAGWRGDCLAVNKEWRLVIPNFHSAECTEAKVMARYKIYETRHSNRK